jgi:hypothetical protein
MAAWDTSVRTLIPEAGTYGVAILVVYGLSSFSLASEIWMRWMVGRGVSILYVYAAALAGCVAWGLVVLEPDPVTSASPIACALSMPIGLAIGHLAGRCDRAVIRHVNRRTIRHPVDHRQGSRRPPRVTGRPVRAVPVSISGSLAQRRSAGLHRVRPPRPEDQVPGRGEVVAVAALEELVYRGVLVSACFLLPGSMYVALALAGLIVAFALPHVWFGWAHVLAKLPLSALTMAAALSLSTVLPAVIGHIVFNIRVRQDMRAGAYGANRP